MTASEVGDVLRRAVEAGYFDEAVLAYLNAPTSSEEEALAYQELFYRAFDLVGRGTWLPPVELMSHEAGTGAALYGTRMFISSRHLRDHLVHSKFAGLFREEFLTANAVDFDAEIVENVRLAQRAGGGFDESTRR